MPVKYISDCHGARVIHVNGEKGICSQCKEECWACDREMLKPLSLEQVKQSYDKKHANETNANNRPHT